MAIIIAKLMTKGCVRGYSPQIYWTAVLIIHNNESIAVIEVKVHYLGNFRSGGKLLSMVEYMYTSYRSNVNFLTVPCPVSSWP